MVRVSIKEAKNRFSELVRLAEAGERVVVTRNGGEVIEFAKPKAKGGLDLEGYKRWRAEKGHTEPTAGWISDDFDDPLPEDFLITPLPSKFWDGPKG